MFLNLNSPISPYLIKKNKSKYTTLNTALRTYSVFYTNNFIINELYMRITSDLWRLYI